MNICTRLLLVFVVCGIAACNNGTYELTDPPVYTLALDTPRVSGNKVVIRWSSLGSAPVQSITLTRADSARRIVSVISLAPTATEYADTFLLSRNIQYFVTARVVGGSIDQTVVSNTQNFTRPDIEFLGIVPNRALFDRDSRSLLMTSLEGDIALYDLDNKRTVRQIATATGITGFSLGTYNGRKELYVSRYDGWLFIYDATTLDLVEQINIGMGMGNAVYNDGKFFISTGSIGATLIAYDRATKTKISDTAGYFSYMALRMLPGTATSLIGIYSTGQVQRFNFNSSGVFLSEQTSAFFTQDIAISPFEVYPDGEKFITSGSGTIFSKDLQYLSGLPHGSVYFNSFDFDNTNRHIYAGCTEQQVSVYSMDNYQFIKTIQTKGYPIRVFYDNGTVISVSSDYGSPNYSSVTFVERL